MAVGAGLGCNDIASGIAGVRFGIERGMLGQGTQVDKHPRHAGEHLAIFDDRVVIACVGKRFGQMMADFEDAGFGGKRSIPCASVLGTEAHRLARLGVSKAGVDKFRMWNAMNKLVFAQTSGSSGFGDQPPACRSLDFGQQGEKDPSAAMLMAELWQQAGLPDGVFNVVHGDKEAVDRLLQHPDVAAISFVGSTPIARYVYETGTQAGKRVQALGGAKNHMLVLPDADLELAADSAVNAGFGSAGERCMAISVLVVVEPVADELIAKIAGRMATLRVGDGRRGSDMGPLVTAAHRDKVRGYVDAGVEAGATLVVDGRDIAVDGEAGGFWLGPTLFDRVTPEMSIYSEEIFGPVLSVVRVASYQQGLELINSHPYGNGTAIFTCDGGAARRFQHEVSVGMIGINVPIPVPMAYYSFGGWKASLFGDTHAHGAEGFHFFTRGKVVTSRWPDPSHGGINLGFPTHG